MLKANFRCFTWSLQPVLGAEELSRSKRIFNTYSDRYWAEVLNPEGLPEMRLSCSSGQQAT